MMRTFLGIFVLTLALAWFGFPGGLFAEEKDIAPSEKADDLEPLVPEEDGELTPVIPESDSSFEDSLPPPPSGFEEVTLREITKDKQSLFEIHGYFRLRGDLTDRADLGLSPMLNPDPYPMYPKSALGRTNTLAGANMRLRVEPTIIISEDILVMSQIDILDNVVLGSTPGGYPRNGYTPMVLLSDGQLPPSLGYNSITDSIRVKRVWGDVKTEFGTLRFGRMPFHWGLGLLANDGGPYHQDRGPLVTQPKRYGLKGQCFDCDLGTTVDRIMFIFPFAGHTFMPMIDFTAEGPYSARFNQTEGQPMDLDQLDDVNSYMLAIAKNDKPEDIHHAVKNEEWLLNYGLYLTYRHQQFDAVGTYNPPEGGSNPFNMGSITPDQFAVRHAKMFIPDLWARFVWDRLRIEFEFTLVAGRFGYTNLTPNLDAEGKLVLNEDGTLNADVVEGKASMLQWGGVVQADYSFLNDMLFLGLELGVASGDSAEGFGVLNPHKQMCTSNNRSVCPVRDTTMNQFRFHPDYHVDMLLWRQIIGTVTDAFYLKPSLQYNIAESFGAKLSAIFSSALESESTRGKSHPLGLEFNLDFFYFSTDNFHAGFAYGLLIPFAGMDDLGTDKARGGIEGTSAQDHDAQVAHRIAARLVLHF